MSTYNELCFDILSLLKNSQISDDTDISLEHILFHVNNQRSLWLRNEYNKPGRKIDQHLVQDFGCLEIEAVPAIDCCQISSDCYQLRTKKKIPQLLELHNGPALTRVGPANRLLTPFHVIQLEQAPFTTHNKFTSNDIKALLMNDYIYLIIPSACQQGIEFINVRGIVADPKSMLEFRCDDSGLPCFSYDDEYPVNNWMLPYIKTEILKQFGVSTQIPKDSDNNAKDNVNQD